MILSYLLAFVKRVEDFGASGGRRRRCWKVGSSERVISLNLRGYFCLELCHRRVLVFRVEKKEKGVLAEDEEW